MARTLPSSAPTSDVPSAVSAADELTREPRGRLQWSVPLDAIAYTYPSLSLTTTVPSLNKAGEAVTDELVFTCQTSWPRLAAYTPSPPPNTTVPSAATAGVDATGPLTARELMTRPV
jgi:hypothetical protein